MTFISCKKESDIGGSIVIDNTLILSLLDNRGDDLLKFYSADRLSKIRLYYLKGDKKELYHQSNLTDEYGIRLIPPSDKYKHYRLSILLYNDGTFGENILTTTYLDWGDGNVDTVVGSFSNDKNNQILVKFKFNKDLGDFRDKHNFAILRK